MDCVSSLHAKKNVAPNWKPEQKVCFPRHSKWVTMPWSVRNLIFPPFLQGKAIGVTIGCILGMFPLLFFGDEEEKLEEKN